MNGGSKNKNMETFLSQVPAHMMAELVEMYKMDFEMFGYPIPDFKAGKSCK